jgi:DNA recombination protein Rad52
MLDAPLQRAFVKERSQAGRTFSYIEAWKAIEEANRIFGHDGWNRELLNLRLLGDPREVDGKIRVAYMATVRIHVGETFRDGSGFGSGIDKDVDQAHESALKEAESDAMKRALMTFGNPFGLALYDKTQANVVDAPRAGINPAPPGPDFPGAEGSPGRSSYAAKKDGGSERFIQLQDEIATLESSGAISSFIAERQEEIKTLPEAWRKILREKLDDQKHFLSVA